jgi:hypothetical protein
LPAVLAGGHPSTPSGRSVSQITTDIAERLRCATAPRQSREWIAAIRTPSSMLDRAIPRCGDGLTTRTALSTFFGIIISLRQPATRWSRRNRRKHGIEVGGIGLNRAPMELFADQSLFGISARTPRDGRSQPGPGLRSNAGPRVREEHVKKLTIAALQSVDTPGTARSVRTYGLPCPERRSRT